MCCRQRWEELWKSMSSNGRKDEDPMAIKKLKDEDFGPIWPVTSYEYVCCRWGCCCKSALFDSREDAILLLSTMAVLSSLGFIACTAHPNSRGESKSIISLYKTGNATRRVEKFPTTERALEPKTAAFFLGTKEFIRRRVKHKAKANTIKFSLLNLGCVQIISQLVCSSV